MSTMSNSVSTMKHSHSTSTMNSSKTKTMLTKSNVERKVMKYTKSIVTDEHLNWLNPAQTLREQGVNDNEELILRRRYFYSDQYVEQSDPKQLKLLFEQCKEGIIGGTQPVNEDKAIQLAALQTFISYGPYNVSSKAIDNKWNLKDCLPPEFTKKKLKPNILEEYKKLNINELKAMSNYVNICRNLPTYGITFFLVKERAKGKKKLLPKLFGVSKSHCYSIDPKTKTINPEQMWKLEHIHKWATSSSSFILNFGDHHPMYAIQTHEGEVIAQLIAGYVEIILKNRRTCDRYNNSFEAESGTIQQGKVITGKGAVVRKGEVVQRTTRQGMHSFTQGYADRDSQVIGGNVNSGFAKQKRVSSQGSYSQAVLEPFIYNIKNCKSQLKESDGADPAQSQLGTHHQIVSNTCGILRAVPDLLLNKSEDDQARALNEMTSHLEGLSQACKDMAKFWGDEDDNSRNLLRAAEDVMSSMQELLQVAYTNKTGQNNVLFPEAAKLSENAQKLLHIIGANDYPEHTDYIEELVRKVTNKTAQLIKAAKGVANECKNQSENHDEVITTAMQCALDTSTLVTVTRSLAPVAEHNRDEILPVVQQSCDKVENSVKTCVDISHNAVGEHTSFLNLNEAAQGVIDALNELLDAIRKGPQSDENKKILEATNGLLADLDSHGLVSQTNLLKDAATDLVKILHGQATMETDNRRHDRLLNSARGLADAATRMVLAAKSRADNPENPKHLNDLKAAARDLRSATDQVEQARKAISDNLIQAANHASICASHLTTCSKSCLKELDDDTLASPVAESLNQAVIGLDNETSNFLEKIQACKHAHLDRPELEGPALGQKKSDERRTMKSLCDGYDQFQQVAIVGIQRARGISSTVSKKISSPKSANLTKASTRLASALDKLHLQIEAAVELLPVADAASAIQEIKNTDLEISKACQNMREGLACNHNLPIAPAQSSSKIALDGREVARAIASLISAASRGDAENAAQSCSETANACKNLGLTARGIEMDNDSKIELLESTSGVLESVINLIETSQVTIHNTDDKSAHQNLIQAGKRVTEKIHKCIRFTPGQSELESCSNMLQPEEMNKIFSNPDLSNEIGHSVLQASTNKLSESLQKVAKLSDNCKVSDLVESVSNVTKDSVCLSRNGSIYIKQNNLEPSNPVYKALHDQAADSRKLVIAAKQYAIDTSHSANKNRLHETAKLISDAVNTLLAFISDASIVEKKCEEISLKLNSILPQKVSSSKQNDSYFECVRNLQNGYTSLSVNVYPKLKSIFNCQESPASNIDELTDTLKELQNVVENVSIKNSLHAAYLIAADDPETVKAIPGLIDTAMFQSAQEKIQSACRLMGEASQQVSHQDLLAAATVIAKNTSELCVACRNVSVNSLTSSANKRNFVKAARDVANQTALLVRAIKALDGNDSMQARRNLADVAEPLSQAFSNLYHFATLPEYAGQDAKLSIKAIDRQQPILNACGKHVKIVQNVLTACKVLANAEKGPSEVAMNDFDAQCELSLRYLKETIVALNESAPGQEDCEKALVIYRKNMKDIDELMFHVVDNVITSDFGKYFLLQGTTSINFKV